MPLYNPSEDGWSTPTLINSWSNFGSPYSPAVYYKDGIDRVHLRGLVKGGATSSNMFVLPVGYRPTHRLVFLTFCGAMMMVARIDVDSSGIVQFVSGSNDYVSLSGISFRALI